MMASQLSPKRAVESPVIPDRLYFKIGDVARLCGVETYVLRFWESQFPQLKPNKSGTGQRLYRRRDVEMALEIKRLVHDEGYTLAGARQALDAPARRRDPLPEPQLVAPVAAPIPATKNGSASAASAIARVRAELQEIALLLSTPQQAKARPRGRLIKAEFESDSLFPL